MVDAVMVEALDVDIEAVVSVVVVPLAIGTDVLCVVDVVAFSCGHCSCSVVLWECRNPYYMSCKSHKYV